MAFSHPNYRPKLLIGTCSLANFVDITYFDCIIWDSSNLMVDEQETSNKKRLDYKIDAYKSYEYAYIFAYGGNQN